MSAIADQSVEIEFYGHDQAINLYCFSGTLTLTHAMHIGSGRGDLTTDALVVTDGAGKPIIPGSSFRGLFRSHIERLLAGLNAAGVTTLWACQLYDASPLGICIGNQVNQESKDKLKELVNRAKTSGLPAIWNDLPKALCSVCQLFGASAVWASKIKFSDLNLLNEPLTQIRHGVGIHRDSGTAAPGVKYDKLVVEAGREFKFEAIAENLTEQDKRLLALGFQAILNGTAALGGSTGRGLGDFALTGGDVSWVDCKNKSDLVNYLLKKEYSGSQSLDDFVNETLNTWLAPQENGGGDAQTAAE
ncbi:hypothetical protein ADN00_12990 [Ornatilinea apprima]|uniref:CRISPR type III-associated protein domain-containing protein n=1 Tax=Ornatilinea apprima TaxID=1134406 RepID=A0A0P6XK26_9CHLR|nr:CRISPR-associated RAMP protein Csx7 [Ornatilinea apprima]KPL75301.1 hypothetical protein ADN00_12990 [Ornatilinea apprima]